MKTRKIFLFVLFAILGFSACQQEDTLITPEERSEEGSIIIDEQQYNFFLQQAEEERNAMPFDSIKLSNGSQLQFFRVDLEGESELMVLEVSDCEECSVLSLISDTTATVEDYYWAFSTPGTPIPEILKSEAPQKQGQGWAIGKVAELDGIVSSRYACNNSSFGSSMVGGFLPGDTYRRYDRRPNNYSQFKYQCFNPATNGQCLTRFKFESGWYHTKKWRGKICTRSVQTSSNNHNYLYCGPGCSACSSGNWCTYNRSVRVAFQRWTGSYWSNLGAVNVPHNQTKTYSWYVNGSSNKYYQLRVDYALPYDEFDFMMDQD